jgi:hypothetical protein
LQGYLPCRYREIPLQIPTPMAFAFGQTARLQALRRRYNDSEVPTNSQSRALLPMLTLSVGLPSFGSRSVGNDVFGDADFAERSHDDEQREQLEQLERVAARRLRQRFKAERIASHISTRLLEDEEYQQAVAVYGEADRVNNLTRECSSQGGALKKVFGIGEHDGKIPSSRLVHPLSPFHLFWTSLTAMFLLYTAIVVPAVIAFHWTDEECTAVPTLVFDCMLDTFFLVGSSSAPLKLLPTHMCWALLSLPCCSRSVLQECKAHVVGYDILSSNLSCVLLLSRQVDILYSFCVGVVYQGEYFDDWRWVARRYVSTAFLFDLGTSIPVSYIELAANAACSLVGGLHSHTDRNTNTNTLCARELNPRPSALKPNSSTFHPEPAPRNPTPSTVKPTPKP